MFKKITLWLFVLILGITFGAGLYEARIVVPDWIHSSNHFWNADAANQSNTGLRFWVYISSIPLTLVTLTSFVLMLTTTGHVKKWWAVSVVSALIDRIITFSYFVPTMIGLMEYGNSSEKDVVDSAILWADLNYVRIAIVFIAWISAIRALTAYYEKNI